MLVEEHLELPRFTSTLRAFSGVSRRAEVRDPNSERQLIQKRRQQLLEPVKQQSLEVPSWNDLILRLIPNANDPKFAKLKPNLDKLRNTIAKQFLNEDFNDSSMLNDAALFILQKFYEFRNPAQPGKFQNLDKLSKKMRERFGQFQRNLFDSCRENLESIFAELSYLNRLALLDQAFDKRELIEAPVQSDAHNNFFGENLRFYSFYEGKVMKTDEKDEEEESDESDEESEPSEAGVTFNFPTDATPAVTSKV